MAAAVVLICGVSWNYQRLKKGDAQLRKQLSRAVGIAMGGPLDQLMRAPTARGLSLALYGSSILVLECEDTRARLLSHVDTWISVQERHGGAEAMEKIIISYSV